MKIFQLVLLGSVLSVAANAATIVLTFDGLQNAEEVLDYYDGGFGSLGSGPGPNDGITFNSDAQAFIQDQDGGTGNEAGLPGGDTSLIFLSGSAATMNVPAGFTTGFSFYYSAVFDPGTINVWSGLNDTGTLLTTLSLPVTPSEVGTNPECTMSDEEFCPFFAFGVTFSGTAMSVDFGGTENQIAFDNITLGSSVPGSGTPEPVTSSLLAMGLVSIAAISRRQRKRR
jgi:hypothetical protein